MEQREQRVTGSVSPGKSLKAKSDRLFLSLDIGSTSSDIVVMDEHYGTLYSDYRRTKGRPIPIAAKQIKEVLEQFPVEQFDCCYATGSAARWSADKFGFIYINEVMAQAAAIRHLYPNLSRATIIEMGGQDSKLIFIGDKKDEPVRDFALNTSCAAGTGSFLDQQADRLGIDIEEQFGQLALKSTNPPVMAGRCSVFAKSDMIHLQQQAAPVEDIIAGLCFALARNLKSNLGCGREFIKPIVFTGGVAANAGVVRAIRSIFELNDGQLLIPENHFFTGAIGAALLGRQKNTNRKKPDFSEILSEHSRQTQTKRSATLKKLHRPQADPSSGRVFGESLQADTPVDAFLGVDVGSISTNVVAIDTEMRVLAKSYLMTAGRPMEAVKKGLQEINEKIGRKINVLSAATTGSGRYLTGDFIGADVVINEITAQATGAALVNPDVDTIFEIGGQDSKYISLNNGVVVDFEMNHACAAGTGSFLEEQAQRLNIRINKEFAEMAFQSESPTKLGDRCTVFMESDLLSYQQQGAQTKDLVAGLAYSIVNNYLNRVVGRRRIGSHICFQGGTAFNHAVWAAFEKVTGRKITIPNHHEVTGAIGAAVIAARRYDQENVTKFKGFDNLAHIKYDIESFACEHCPNNCEIRKVIIEGSEPLYYGSRCDRYNIRRQRSDKNLFDAFAFRRKTMLQCAGLTEKDMRSNALPSKGNTPVIGIPMALTSHQFLPLFVRFFKQLGFNVLPSGNTTRKVVHNGVEMVTAQPCLPVKVAYGHVKELIDRGVDYIFVPSILTVEQSFENNKHNKLCPYVQSLPYQIRAAFDEHFGPTKLLTVPIRLGEGRRLMHNSFYELGAQIKCSKKAVRKALEAALEAQQQFERSLRQKGTEMIRALNPDEKLFIIVSRPYNGCDDGVSLDLSKKLADKGIQAVPLDMIDLSGVELSDTDLHSQMYWSYGQRILRAAELVRTDPKLFAIYLSNFSCGPDSFLQTFFRSILDTKPALVLELDEHSADAGMITRIEAFLESLRNYQPKQSGEKTTKPLMMQRAKTLRSGQTLHLPYMGDCAHGVAAGFRRYGQKVRVFDVADEQTLLRGRAYTSGKECLPCAITLGDMMKTLEKNGDDSPAFFMPTTSGPCRFGMYHCMHRMVLNRVLEKDVSVIAPNQDSSFYREFARNLNGSGRHFMRDIWISASVVDLLGKLILRIRPYATDPAKAQRIYDDAVRLWTEEFAAGINQDRALFLVEEIAADFERIDMDFKRKKPLIGIVGEIYVRSHPFANNYVIRRLEELGAACELAPLAEWIYYVNFTRKNQTRRQRQYISLLYQYLYEAMQHKLEKKFARPFEQRFGKLAEPPVEKTIEAAAPYVHHSFEGEAILSVGKTIEFHHHGVGGVVNVMPFSCMPSTIVSSLTQYISRQCDNMPILNITFDGQEDPTLTTRLEAFVEQVAARQNAQKTITERIGV